MITTSTSVFSTPAIIMMYLLKAARMSRGVHVEEISGFFQILPTLPTVRTTVQLERIAMRRTSGEHGFFSRTIADYFHRLINGGHSRVIDSCVELNEEGLELAVKIIVESFQEDLNGFNRVADAVGFSRDDLLFALGKISSDKNENI